MKLHCIGYCHEKNLFPFITKNMRCIKYYNKFTTFFPVYIRHYMSKVEACALFVLLTMNENTRMAM